MTVPRMTDLDRADLVREFICRELVDRVIDEVPLIGDIIAYHYRDELRDLWRARHTEGEDEPGIRSLVERRRLRREV